MLSYAQRLIRWQQQHGRHDLPWQGADAYRVWLSEIMLQQTQVATVIPYYQRFVTSFPTIAALAVASEEQVLAHWSGLGYYARGRNLHRAAQIIVEKHHGEFPREFEQMLELPGIGRSTAAAISALAYHERRAILDGNVKRVLARYCGIGGDAGENEVSVQANMSEANVKRSGRSHKKVEAQLWQQAENLLPNPCPSGERGGFDSPIATYTQALMDMGATICTRSKPKCAICPVQADCIALQTDRIAELPMPRPKKVVPEKHATFLLLMHDNDILLEKRPGSGIWGGLWCPPQFDDEEAAENWFVQNGMNASQGERLEPFTHTFTHFKLHITPLKIQLARKPLHAAQPGSVWLDVEEALRAAIPTPVRAMLNKVVRGEFL